MTPIEQLSQVIAELCQERDRLVARIAEIDSWADRTLCSARALIGPRSIQAAKVAPNRCKAEKVLTYLLANPDKPFSVKHISAALEMPLSPMYGVVSRLARFRPGQVRRYSWGHYVGASGGDLSGSNVPSRVLGCADQALLEESRRPKD